MINSVKTFGPGSLLITLADPDITLTPNNVGLFLKMWEHIGWRYIYYIEMPWITLTSLIQNANTKHTTKKYMFIGVYKYYGVVYLSYCFTVINNTANIVIYVKYND